MALSSQIRQISSPYSFGTGPFRLRSGIVLSRGIVGLLKDLLVFCCALLVVGEGDVKISLAGLKFGWLEFRFVEFWLLEFRFGDRFWFIVKLPVW